MSLIKPIIVSFVLTLISTALNVAAANTSYTYRITGGNGVFNMMGIRQNTPVDPGGTIRFSNTSAQNYSVTLPEITPELIELVYSNNSWTGRMSVWGGEAMETFVTVFGIGTPDAVMEFKGTAPMGTLQMTMELELVDAGSNNPAQKPSDSSTSSDNNGSGNGSTGSGQTIQSTENQANPYAGACNRLGSYFLYSTSSADVSNQARIAEAIEFAKVREEPITDEKCQRALDLIEREGVIANLEQEFGPQSAWQNVAPPSNRVPSSETADNSNGSDNSPQKPLSHCNRLIRLEEKARLEGNIGLLRWIRSIKEETGGGLSAGSCLQALRAIESEGVLASLETQYGPEDSWDKARNPVIDKVIDGLKGSQDAQTQVQIIDNTKVKDAGQAVSNGVANQNGLQNGSTNLGGRDPACRNLRVQLATIMRGTDEAQKTSLRNALRLQGVADIGKASVEQCKNVLAEIGARPVPGSQQNGAQNPILVPANNSQKAAQSGGEDPNTMIEGGKEIPGSEADFEPASKGQSQQSAASQSSSSNSNIPSDMCELANLAVIETVIRGSVPEMARVSQLLNQYNVTDLIRAPLRNCNDIFATMQIEGMVR